jgi:hypothetical protein
MVDVEAEEDHGVGTKQECGTQEIRKNGDVQFLVPVFLGSRFDSSVPVSPSKKENLLVNLLCNVALPTAIMSWASGAHALGPRWGLVVALVFPVGYGLYDFSVRRRFNFISLVGFASVLVSGGFGLMQLDGFWFAVKDAAIPALIGVAVLASMRAKEPLVHEMLYNPQVIDVERVDAALDARGHRAGFRQLMRSSSHLIASAMLLSAVLNFVCARWIIRGQPGTEEFNRELARMHWVGLLGLSLPVMAMMVFALWRLLKGIEALTGLTLDEVLHADGAARKKPGGESPPG